MSTSKASKTLLIMRHAKSSWQDEALADQLRPLNERGQAAAPLVGEELRRRQLIPRKLISSPAVRAMQTAELVVRSFPELPIETAPSFYLGGIQEVSTRLAQECDQLDCVLLLGHNYGWEDVVSWLCGQNVMLKTADCAVLTCSESTWSKALARAGNWQLCDVIRSRWLARA